MQATWALTLMLTPTAGGGLFFLIRFGWLLVLVLAAVVFIQSGILRRIEVAARPVDDA